MRRGNVARIAATHGSSTRAPNRGSRQRRRAANPGVVARQHRREAVAFFARRTRVPEGAARGTVGGSQARALADTSCRCVRNLVRARAGGYPRPGDLARRPYSSPTFRGRDLGLCLLPSERPVAHRAPHRPPSRRLLPSLRLVSTGSNSSSRWRTTPTRCGLRCASRASPAPPAPPAVPLSPRQIRPRIAKRALTTSDPCPPYPLRRP